MVKNPRATNIGGEDFWPLNEDQIQAFHEAAVESDKKMEELVGLGLLYTGMRNTELHHMRPDWLEYSDGDSLRVVVPIEEKCIGGAGRSGRNNEDGRNLHDRGNPCSHCRTSTPDWFKKRKQDSTYSDERWHPKSKAGHRVIPVHEEAAAEVFEWWFNGHNQIPVLHNGVNRRIDKIVERAGIEREVSAHDLRNTYGTMLARRDFGRWKVKQIMGHASLDATEKYVKFVGDELDDAFHEKW